MRRLLDLNLKTLCDNDCIFCRNSKKKMWGKQWDDYDKIDLIREKIKAGARDGFKAICFTGNEVLNHPNIIELIKYARLHKFIDIEVITSGRRLKDVAFLNKLIRVGISEFYLPIYGSDAGVHEAVTRVRGSFQDTMKTLDNLCQYRVPAMLTTIFTKKNFKNIPALTELIIDKYPQIHFKIDSVAAFSNSLLEYKYVTPSFKMALPFLRKAARIYKKRYYFNLSYLSSFVKSFLHMPLCIVSNIFDRDLFNLSVLVRHSKLREGLHFNASFPCESLIKLPSCKFCKFYTMCCGISKFYIKAYGRGEFKYIK